MCMINIYPPFTRHKELRVQQYGKSAAELIPWVVWLDHNAHLLFDALKFHLSLPVGYERKSKRTPTASQAKESKAWMKMLNKI